MPKKPASFHYTKRSRTEEHRQYMMRRGGLSQARQIRSSRDWAKARDLVKARFPICCDPFGDHDRDGRVEPTAHAHHIEPLEKRPDLAFEPLNLAPLCVACHSAVEAMEKRGEATADLFDSFRVELMERFGDG